MSDILKKWLVHQLGLEAHSLYSNGLCSKFQNGVFIGKILQNYNVVDSKELSMLVDRDDEEAKISNFRHIKTWLNMINVSLDNDTVDGMMSGQISEIVGFFYVLCFHLESPDSLNLIRYAKQLYSSLGSFDFLGVTSRSHAETAANVFSYEKKRQEFTDNNNASAILKKSSTRTTRLCDEIDRFERNLPAILNSWNARGDQSCIRYLSELKSRKRYSKIYECWRKEATRAYLETNLDASARRNRKMLRNKSMPDKLIRVSECEEIMLEKINSTRFFTKETCTVSVKDGVRLVFDDRAAPREKWQRSEAIVGEKIRLDLDKELTARNDRRRKADRTEMVKIVVRELVDLGVRIGSRRRSRRGVSRSFLDDSAEMFVRGRPLWEDALNDSIHMLLDPRFVDDNRPRTDDALKTQSVLNRRDVSQYLKRSGNWWGRALLGTTDQQDPASELRVLGFLVHDVLASIHALPASLVDTRNVALAPITAVLERDDNDDDDDDALIRELCIALDKRNMTAVLPRTAVQYCLSAYCRCSDAGELAKLLENNQGVTTDSSDVSDSEVVLDDLNEMFKSRVTQSKQTQTSDGTDTACESERIECGKKAFINIYRGEPLSKNCLVDCVLCYLKHKNTYGGHVLVGFRREEIIILEERLAQKHFPPFGSHCCVTKNENPTILVPFKGPDLGDEGRYVSSFSSYLKVLSDENLFDMNLHGDDMLKYYKSQNILTLLQRTEKNVRWDGRKVELLCDVLTGQTVNWSEESDWVNCIYNAKRSDGKKGGTKSFETVSSPSNTPQKKEFKRERLHEKSEFDFIDHLSNVKLNTFSSTPNSSHSRVRQQSSTSSPTDYEEVKSEVFNVQLGGNAGVVLGAFWKSLESAFVDDMERSMFHRRILVSEQEYFVATMKKHASEALNMSSTEKIELVNCLQSDLFNVPDDALRIPSVTKQLLLTVSDVRYVLMQLVNTKIENCGRLVKNENIRNWLDVQMSLMLIVYKCMLQTEVDRVVNTLIFINAYMSKMYKQKLQPSLIPKKIEVSQINWSDKKLVQTDVIADEYFNKFYNTVNVAIDRVKNIFSPTSEWLEETKETQNSNSAEKSNVHLKIWKYLVESQSWSSVNQLKLLLARYHNDIKEMESFVTQCRSNIVQQIDNRSRYEITGVERVCDLFVSAINERQRVRHEIIFTDDHFYLNSENILYPGSPPPQPIPLLEPDNPYVISVNDLETMANQLTAISPDGRISLVAFSAWLTSYAKYFSRYDWLKPATTVVLRSMFGHAVHYVDWTDFVINCLELPCPDADDLLELKHKYRELDTAKRNDPDQECTAEGNGCVDESDFDSVPLWFEKSLPSNPSVHLRHLKIKRLLFKMFSTDDKLDYVTMLFALCKDDNCSVVGFMKAICLVVDENVAFDGQNVSVAKSSSTVQLPFETLRTTLVSRLGSYVAPGKSDLEDSVSSVFDVHGDESERHDSDVFTVSELFENDKLKLLTETGLRFNSRHLSKIVKTISTIDENDAY